MKVSLNWVKQFIDVGLSPDELAQKIGAQLGAIEETVDLGKRYQGIVVAKIVSCEKHPDADKLSLCLIDDGRAVKDVDRDESGYVQVVCGAPNAKAGLTVAWIPPGVTVPSTADKEPFVLEARDIRGKVSNGMLASPKELGLSDDHEGILEISERADPGTALIEVYDLDDTIFDIENKMFTHRPDCFGILGVAREIAGICQQQFKSPDWYLRVTRSLVFPAVDRLPLKVSNQLPELVPRFMTITMKDVTVKPSPTWLQSQLTRVGIRPINNIVDITNFLMYLTAQPLHAYDYDKVAAQAASGQPPELVIRYPQPDEKVQLLNGKEIQPRAEAIMIASGRHLIGVGGVMGGSDTEVDANTKNIILEVATFDMFSIRRTSMEHGLFTDAVARFNKGQSPLQDDKVIAKAIEMVQELASGQVGGKLNDDMHVNEDSLAVVEVTAQFINERLGFTLDAEAMATLLRNVEFGVDVNKDNLKVTTPFWRTDIAIPEDIVEEVGRLYGYDHLPLSLPQKNLKPVARNEMLDLNSRIRGILAAGGANEVLTYSFVHSDLLAKVGQNKDQAFQLSNAISPDLQYFRLSLTPSLLDKVHANAKAGYDEFALFEIGTSHTKLHATDDDGLPTEFKMLALVIAGSDKSPSAQSGAGYYMARKYLDFLGSKLGLVLDYKPLKDMPDYPVTAPFEAARSALVGVRGTDISLGVIGEFKATVRRGLKLPVHTAGFEIGLDELHKAAATGNYYRPLSRFPEITQDISLRVESGKSYQVVSEFLAHVLPEMTPPDTTATLEPLNIYQKADDPSHKTYTFRLTFVSNQRTLVTEEVTSLLDGLAAKAASDLGAERV